MADVARFLLPNPPRDDRDVKRLFVNRASELRQALDQVMAVRKNHLGQPMALVGQARVGKSHLLQQIANQVAKKFDVAVRIEVSTGLSEGRSILREILRQTHAGFHNALLKKGLGPAEGPGALLPLERILVDFSEAIAGSASEVELSRVEVATKALKMSLSTKLPGLTKHLGDLAFTPQLGIERTQSESESVGRRVRVNRFEESHLTDLIGMAHSLVVEHAPRKTWRTLLVLDDFDLLKRDEEGAFEPEALLQSLAALARIPGLYVLTTVRQDTYRRHDKTFHRIGNVLPFNDDGLLVEIYERHVKHYHDGDSPFDDSFVRDVARLANGRPGVFLEHLQEAFLTVEPEELKNLKDVPSWIESRWQPLLQAEPELGSVLVGAAKRVGNIQAEDLARLRRSAFMEWVLEGTTSEKSARVDPLLYAVLRGQSASMSLPTMVS
jgi:hypothetical protein